MKLEDLLTKYKNNTLSIARVSCAIVSGEVIDGTPVLSGSLRASWNASIGQPVANNINIGIDANGKATGSHRNNFTSVVNSLVVGDFYSFANGQPYARRIEYEGWSDYAPNGMLTPAVANWNRIVASAAKGASA